MPISIKIIQNEDAFFALKGEWNSLLKKSSANNIILTWEWISTWWSYFGKDSKLYLLVARSTESKKLIGIAPLHIHTRKIKKRLFPLHTLAFIGANDTAPDHLDFIVHPDHEAEVKKRFVTSIQVAKAEWDLLDLDGICENSGIVEMLTNQTPSLRYYLDITESPTIKLPISWEEMEKALGKNLRYNIRRYNRKMEKEHPGTVRYERICDIDRIDNTINILINFAEKVRQKHHEKHALANEAMRQFHQVLAKQLLQKDWLRLYTLSIGSESIAVLYCYNYAQNVFYYQTGYDLEWRKYGPGRQILAHGIREAIAERAGEFDFLRGEHAYKEEWANAVNKDYVLKIAYSLYGQLVVLIYKMVRGIKKRSDES